jgi:hypothetical protein
MKKLKSIERVLIVSVFVKVLPLIAGTFTWNSTSSTDFNNTANWTGTGTPDFSDYKDEVIFPTRGSLVDPVLTANAKVWKLNFSSTSTWNPGASSYVLSIGAGGFYSGNDGGTHAWNIEVATNQIWSIYENALTLILSGNLSGSGHITKMGEGDITFSGNNSAFSGGITLISGQLRLESSCPLGTGVLRIAGS